MLFCLNSFSHRPAISRFPQLAVLKKIKELLTFLLFFPGNSASFPSLAQYLLRLWQLLEGGALELCTQSPAHIQGPRIPKHSHPRSTTGRRPSMLPQGTGQGRWGMGPLQGLCRTDGGRPVRGLWLVCNNRDDPHMSRVLLTLRLSPYSVSHYLALRMLL